MPKLPDPQTAAGQASYRSVKNVMSAGEMDLSGAFKGQAQMGKALQDVGQTVMKIGGEEKQRRDSLELMEKDAAMDAEARELARAFENDPDPSTAMDRYQAQLGDLRKKYSSTFSDPTVGKKWDLRWQQRGNAAIDSMHGRVEARKKDKWNADFLSSMETSQKYWGSKNVSADDVADDVQKRMEDIDAAERQNLISAETAQRARMSLKEKGIEVYNEKQILLDPDKGADNIKFYREMKEKRRSSGPIPVPDVKIEAKQPPLKRTVGAPRQSPIKGVALHQTWGSDTMDGNGSWSNKTNTGANYYIDKDGNVFAWAPDEVRMNHIGKGRNGSRPDLTNDSTIGIEIMTRPNERPNAKQIAAARSLSLSLAEQYGFDPTKDVVGHGEITRSSHRRPDEAIEVVKAIREGTMTVGGQSEGDGKPVPVAKRGLTQYAGLKSDTMTDATAAAPESEISPEDEARFRKLDALWGGMSDLELAKMDAKYRKQSAKRYDATRQKLHDSWQSDIDMRMRGQRNPEFDPAASQGILEPSVIGKYQRDQARADAYWAATSGETPYYGEKIKTAPYKSLSELSELELNARLSEVGSGPGDGDNAINKKWVQDQVEKEIKEIKRLRAEDIAAAVDRSERVQDVVALQTAASQAESGVAPGQTIDVSGLMGQDRSAIVKARLQAQDDIDIPKTSQRIITKSEAVTLLPDDFAAIGYKDVKPALQAAAQRAEQMFGPTYARRALEEAVKYRIAKGEKNDMAASIVKKIAFDEPVTRSDMRAFADYEAVSISDGFMAAPTADYLEPRPAISPFNNMMMEDQAAQAEMSASLTTVPNVAQVEWAMADPQRRGPVIDRIFGAGTFARAQANQGNK